MNKPRRALAGSIDFAPMIVLLILCVIAIVTLIIPTIKEFFIETQRYSIVSLSPVEGLNSDSFIIDNKGDTYKIYINKDNGIEQKGFPVDITTIFKTKDIPYVVIEVNGNDIIKKVELYVPENFIVRDVAGEIKGVD